MTSSIVADSSKYPESATGGIQEAIHALPESGGRVLIPAGRYRLRHSLQLKSRVTLCGEGAATLLTPAKKPIVRKLKKTMRAGETALTLEDASGLETGDQLFIWDASNGGWNTRYLIITRLEGNRVSGDIIYGYPKLEYAVERNAMVSNYFPGLWITHVDEVTIASLCLEGGEFNHEEKHSGHAWTAAIHTKNANNLRIRDITVRRWPADGISVQGGTAIISGCIVEDCLTIGLHPGTNIRESIWTGNISRRNGSGFFFCVGCKNTLCVNNLLLNNKGPGIHGLADPDRYNVVMGNICAGNGEMGIDASGSFGNIISGNLLYENSRKLPGVYPGIMLQLHQDTLVTGNLCLDDRETPTQIRGIESLKPQGHNVIGNNYCSGGALIEERNIERENAALQAVLEGGAAAGKPMPVPARWGKPVFADDFSAKGGSAKARKSGRISSRWKPEGDQFKIVEGLLTGHQKISIARKFTGRAVRLDYDVLVMSETASCDASVMAEAPGFDFLATLGGYYNTQSTLRINREDVTTRLGAVLLRCRRQHVAMEWSAGKIAVALDGNPFLEYAGAKVPGKFQDLALSLYAWAPGIYFGNVKVFLFNKEAR